MELRHPSALGLMRRFIRREDWRGGAIVSMDRVAKGKARKPANSAESEGESECDDGVGEVTLRLRFRPRGFVSASDRGGKHRASSAVRSSRERNRLMMPAGTAPSLKVEPQLSLEVLVGSRRASRSLIARMCGAPCKRRGSRNLYGASSPPGRSMMSQTLHGLGSRRRERVRRAALRAPIEAALARQGFAPRRYLGPPRSVLKQRAAP
jgi:hypothetical protein